MPVSGSMHCSCGRSPARPGDRPLVVVPTGALQSLPWSILLRAAAGQSRDAIGRPLARWPARRRPGRARYGGTGPGAYRCPARVPGRRGACTRSAALRNSGDGPGVAAWMARAGLAAHGRILPKRPAVHLTDVRRRPAHRLRLNGAARGYRASSGPGRLRRWLIHIRAGDELLGLRRDIPRPGTRHVIASVVPVPDAETAPLMIAFHRLLAAGEPAAPALARAQEQLGHTHPPARKQQLDSSASGRHSSCNRPLRRRYQNDQFGPSAGPGPPTPSELDYRGLMTSAAMRCINPAAACSSPKQETSRVRRSSCLRIIGCVILQCSWPPCWPALIWC